jgi:nicotinamidase/pyrazinamidase
MSYALIVTGMQYDHLPGGPLQTPNADQILAPISQLIHDAEIVVAVREWHPENHYTFSEDPRHEDHSWPPHCVQGTKGARIHSSIRRHSNYVVSMGMNRNEEAYSAFAGKTLRPVYYLEEILAVHEVNVVVVAGIRYSVEVKHTALDANALGYRTVVPLDTTIHEGDPNSADTREKFTRAGVILVPSYRYVKEYIDNDSHEHMRSS